MSHIPNSAMPHAGSNENSDQKGGKKGKSGGTSLSDRAAKIADAARENPKTAVAAGVAVVGAIAAAAVPLVRGRKKAAGEGAPKKSGGTKASGSRKSGGKTSGDSGS